MSTSVASQLAESVEPTRIVAATSRGLVGSSDEHRKGQIAKGGVSTRTNQFLFLNQFTFERAIMAKSTATEPRRVTLADRQRVIRLIDSLYSDKFDDIPHRVSEDECDDEVEKLVKTIGLGPHLQKIEKLESQIKQLQREASSLVNKYMGKPSDNACSCTDFKRVLESIAHTKAQEKLKSERNLLLAEKRKLLARVEVASTSEQMEKVLKDAGLL